jgi:DNA-binding NarL/FixJ family response regulator
LPSAVEAALDAIDVAAALIGARGEMCDANAAARLLLAGTTDVERLKLVHEADGDRSGWTVRRIDTGGGERSYLLLEKKGDRADGTAAAFDRWALTTRQRDVALRVIAGESNRTIGKAIGISERTVEVHVTAILEKAGVESRAALVAAVYTQR